MYLRLAITAVISIVLAGAGWKCYTMGREAVQRAWDAEKAASVLAAAESARKQQQTADSVARTVHQAAHQERVVYRTITREVARVSNDCPASADFRLLHDAAATATEVPPASAARTDVAPVAAQVVAETVIDNYEACRDSMRRLEALQSIIRAYNEE
ncbi:MAG: hypothetical protein NBV65_02075 [Burkholderiaceae bacterium]|nr:hypothetical protein [Burkholderiaceae bacterium]